jgi:hypothetical protein
MKNIKKICAAVVIVLALTGRPARATRVNLYVIAGGAACGYIANLTAEIAYDLEVRTAQNFELQTKEKKRMITRCIQALRTITLLGAGGAACAFSTLFG